MTGEETAEREREAPGATVATIAPDGAREPAAETAIPARRPHVWPAAIMLYLLAAVIPEMLSGSTPPLRFIQPRNLVFLPLLYGSSALLIHEAVARRRLGWANVLLLGAAFGVFQEALVVQTWFTYGAPASAAYTATAYSVARGIDWSAAIAYTCYHSVISVALPLLFVTRLFPRQAALPWLGPRSGVFLALWLLVPSGGMAVNIGVHLFASQGYHGPPQPQYLYAALAVVALTLLGVFLRLPAPRPSPRAAPAIRRVFLTALGLTVLFFLTILALPSLAATRLPAAVPLALCVAVCAWSLWRVRSWSARTGWGPGCELALGLGVLACFAFIMAPLEEFAVRLPQSQYLTLTDLAIFALLTIAALVAARRARKASQPAPVESGA